MKREHYIKSIRDAERLKKENSTLKQQLAKATSALDEIKTGNIDALVIAGKNDHKVYAEESSDKTYRILIEKMHEGALLLNSGGTILYCNSHFALMVAVPLQKLIGTKFRTFVDDATNRLFTTMLKRRNENALKQEILIHTSSGEGMPVLMSVNAWLLNNDTVFSIILTDLTVQNRNQEELKRRAKQLAEQNIELENANKELTAFTFISSHDLQEPLRKIQTFTSILLDEEEKRLSISGKDYLNRMRATVTRMRGLIDALLTYASIKSDERTFEMTDLNVMVANVVKECEEVINGTRATVKAGKLGKVNIIPIQFRQLICNLLLNSLKFSSPKRAPRIIIKTKIITGSKFKNGNLEPGVNYHHIMYSDNGIGFDPRYNERIFEVFQRLHNTDKYPGTGMGLAIVKRIVENHHGTITASGKLNGGSRFDVYIPLT